MQIKDRKITAIILAAGRGSRMNMSETKQKLSILGKSVLLRSTEAFEKSEYIDYIVVVTRADEIDFVKEECKDISKLVAVVIGGSCRAESAKNGFLAIPADTDHIMIHDAARCLVKAEDIEKIAESAIIYGAATASTSVTDSVKLCDSNGMIEESLPRYKLRSMQTPQAFSVDIYSRALAKANIFDPLITDDNALVESIGEKVYCVQTSNENIKITTAEDLVLAEYIISKR